MAGHRQIVCNWVSDDGFLENWWSDGLGLLMMDTLDESPCLNFGTQRRSNENKMINSGGVRPRANV